MSAPGLFLTPVSADDPCGPDLRWNSDFLNLQTTVSALLGDDDGAIVGARAASGPVTPDDVLRTTTALLARTKNIFVMGVHAQARWVQEGLGAYAETMEELLCCVETWPGPYDGVHPRADPDDDDLGERASAFARILVDVPHLAATVGWGQLEDPALRVQAVRMLHDLFTGWRSRLAVALGPESASDAQSCWRAIRTIRDFERLLSERGVVHPASDSDADPSPGASAPSLSRDAWELLTLAAERMQEQSPHSPAVPMLQLVLRWKDMDLAKISEVSRAANGQMGLDQMLDWAKKQLAS